MKSFRLEGIRNPKKIDEISETNENYIHSCLHLVYLVMFWMLYICSVETLFKNLKNLVWRYLNLSNRLMVFFELILDFCLVMIWNVSICPQGAMFKICLKLVDFEGIKNQFKVLSYIWSYFLSLWASWTFLTGAGVKEWWHCLTLLEIYWFWRHQETI